MYPLISLIIPVYNVERYLARCLESVLRQDYPNLEVVLIDDGSTEASSAICDTYAKAYGNIQAHHIPNGGASLARKKGIEMARGEYLTFVDSDDYIAPNYVSALYHLIHNYGTKLSACGVKRVNEKDNDNGNDNGNLTEKLLCFDDLMPRFFKYEYWGFCGGLYHRSVFEGLSFPKATLSEDYLVKSQMFCRERQLAITSQPLYYYEYHPTSLSHTKLSERAFEEFENVRSVYEYVKIHCSDYADYALSNVAETIVKLFSMWSKFDKSQYDNHVKVILEFLNENIASIRYLGMLNKKVKIVARCIVISPKIAKYICRFI